MSRLEILKNSLEKKQSAFYAKLSEHMNDVRGAQGEPMAGHRGGERVLRRWDKQNNSLKTLDASIEKTKAAIEREEYKIANVAAHNEELPELFLKLVNDGVLNQWRKFPNIFFVEGVDKARIGWDAKKKVAFNKYYREITCDEQKKKFRDVYNSIFNQLNAGKV